MVYTPAYSMLVNWGPPSVLSRSGTPTSRKFMQDMRVVHEVVEEAPQETTTGLPNSQLTITRTLTRMAS